MYRRVSLALLWLTKNAWLAYPRWRSWCVMLQAGETFGLVVFIAFWATLQSELVPSRVEDIDTSWKGAWHLIDSIRQNNVIVIEGVSFVFTAVGAVVFAFTTPAMRGESESLVPGSVPDSPWQSYIDGVMGLNVLIMVLYILALGRYQSQLKQRMKLNMLERSAVGVLAVLHCAVKGIGYSAFWNPDSYPANWILWGLFILLSVIQFLVSRLIVSISLDNPTGSSSSWQGSQVLDSIPFLLSRAAAGTNKGKDESHAQLIHPADVV